MEKQRLLISSAPEKLDAAYIHNFLTNSYWAKGRSLDDRQIGYARVLTDYVYFAYLHDVFVDENHRGLGYASKLMSHIVGTPSLQKIKIWRLANDDAHGLYMKFGFNSLKNPHKMMERFKK